MEASREIFGDFIIISILDGFLHRRFFREPYPGIMHFLLFGGACLLRWRWRTILDGGSRNKN